MLPLSSCSTQSWLHLAPGGDCLCCVQCSHVLAAPPQSWLHLSMLNPLPGCCFMASPAPPQSWLHLTPDDPPPPRSSLQPPLPPPLRHVLCGRSRPRASCPPPFLHPPPTQPLPAVAGSRSLTPSAMTSATAAPPSGYRDSGDPFKYGRKFKCKQSESSLSADPQRTATSGAGCRPLRAMMGPGCRPPASLHAGSPRHRPVHDPSFAPKTPLPQEGVPGTPNTPPLQSLGGQGPVLVGGGGQMLL
ncbi:formin-2 isoform X7 [Alligator mississippiensis]|uniref:formin-2 isoform X7 n=1 Tax=Alligator mississippiensis TaxID=8496 RepID=UPI002877AB11|nr:formin-2 isoform X7 [Alligator mississippiensis]